MVTITEPDGTSTNMDAIQQFSEWCFVLFASNSYYDLAAWEWTAPGHTVSIADSYGDDCTCTVFAYRSYAPAQQANDVVFAEMMDYRAETHNQL